MNKDYSKQQWFIAETKDGDNPKYDIRWVHTIVRQEEDSLFCVTMENSYNSPDSRNAKLEWLDQSRMFETVKEAQMEIIRLERFDGRR